MIQVHPSGKNVYEKIKDNFTFDAARPPKDYQRRVLDFMDTNSSLIVFHEMGTGKTVTGLLCAIDFLSKDINNIVYVVASKTLMANWEKEKEAFLVPGSPLASRIFTGTIYDFKNKFKRSTFEPFDQRRLMLIVDESHNYKSAYLERKTIKTKLASVSITGKKSKKTTTVITVTRPSRLSRIEGTPPIVTANRRHRIMKKDSYFLLTATVNIAKKVLFLTGTPFRNTIHDLKNMLQMILILNQLSRTPTLTTSPFDLKVTNKTDVKTFMSAPVMKLPSDEEIKNKSATARREIENLRKMLDYEKRSGDFPPYKIFYEMITPEKAFLKRFLKEKGTKKSVAFTRQRIMSIGFKKSPTAASASASASPSATEAKTPAPALTKELSGKVEYLLGGIPADQYELKYDDYVRSDTHMISRVPNLADTKSVIYSGLNISFLEDQLPDLLRSRPGNEDLQIFFITGNVSKEKREKARTEFNALRNNAVLIISSAAKEGVDLKGVGHVFFIDGVWNPAEFEQIMGRAVRSGSHALYPGVEVQVHILFDKHKEFPQEAMDAAVGKKYTVMKVFKDMTADFNVGKDNAITQKQQKQRRSSLALIPIELTQKEKYKTTFGIEYEADEDDHLDVYQALSVKYTDSIYGPIPDNTAKIFSRVYNHDDSRAFETYFDQLRRIVEGGKIDITLMVFEQNPRDDRIGSEHSTFKVSKKGKTDMSKLKDMSLFLCSTMESDFGHYGVFVLDPATPDKVYYYDSMLHSNEDKNFYLVEFKKLMNRYFILPSQIVVDFPEGPYGPDKIYSMEATGGNPDLENPYVDATKKFTESEKEWCIKFQTLCSDNQNQFCYMWSILYMLCKILFLKGISTVDWKDFLSSLCRLHLLPLVVIKIFITLTIRIMPAEIRQIWSTVPLLGQYFNLITTNATDYAGSFDMSKKDFDLYKIVFPYTSNPNLISTWQVLVGHLKKIRLEKADLEQYKNESVTKAILAELQPVLSTHKVFQPTVPMTYPQIVDALASMEVKIRL
jgi:hypothetical protein